MKLEDTKIKVGGVLRCCIADVACEYEGKEVELGATSSCPHCGEKFTLVMDQYPVWKPDWMLKREENK